MFMEIPFPQESIADIPKKIISPMREMVAYEALWKDKKNTFKTLSNLFASKPGFLPSDFVPEEIIQALIDDVKKIVISLSAEFDTNILIHGSFDYPSKLREAAEPLEVLYYTGNLDILSSRSIAVVGTRKPTQEGIDAARIYVQELVKRKFTIVSGLATGIDTVAHTSAIDSGGLTIGVIGTPLNQSYPSENSQLQMLIAKNYLLLSQVPFIRYMEQTINGNRLFFPERNKTMSALTEATLIIEAGETSGTLTQARAALYQRRKLFILDNCFNNKSLTWPAKFESQGAIRVKSIEDIVANLDA